MATMQVDPRNTVTKLNDSNYQTWKFASMMALKQVNLWRYVTGEAILPESASLDQAAKFEAAADRAMSILALSVEESQFVHISDCNSAKEIWDTLKAIYEPKSLARVLMLRKQFVNIKLESGETMNDYLSRIKTCSEQYREAGGTLSDTEVAYSMMNGLPESYDSLVMTIGSTDQMKLNSADVKKALLIEYDRRVAKSKELPRKEAFQATRSENDVRIVKCFKCGVMGHYARNCRKNRPNQRNKSRLQKGNERVNSNPRDSAFYLRVELNQADSENGWILDSGGTHHTCKNREWFHSFRDIHPNPIRTADGSTNDETNKLYVCGIGDIKMKMAVGNQEFVITMNDVYYAPRIRRNLMSVAQIEKKGKTLTFHNSRVDIFDRKLRKIVAQASREDNLYVIRGKVILPSSHEVQIAATNTVTGTGKRNETELWHLRFCHVNQKKIRKLANNELVRGLKCSLSSDETVCDSCCLAKSTKTPCKRLKSLQSKAVAELIHSDLCGPMPVRSIGGSRYFLTCIDDYSRKMTVYCLKSKDEVADFLKHFIVRIERQTGRKIKRFRTDNGLEFCNSVLSDLFSDLGIRHEKTNVETPQMNGVAERANRTLLDLVRSSLQSAKLPQRFWAEAVMTVSYVLNRVPHSSLQNAVPETVWTGSTPSVRHLRAFGCLAYAHRPSQGRKKLDMRARRCIFVGYATQTRGYRLWDPIRNDIIQTKHVRFDEKRIGHEVIYGPTVPEYRELSDSASDEDRTLAIPASLVEDVNQEIDDEDNEPSLTDAEPTTSLRLSQKREEVRTSPPLTRSRAAAMAQNCECEPPINLNLLIVTEPTTIEEAFSSPQAPYWKAAIQDELDTLEKRKTWEIVDAPPDKQLIGCKWIFKVKNDASGNIQRYRARLVAQGYSQREGIDYQETYSPVASFFIFRILLTITAFRGWVTRHLDIKCAYLYGELKEELYMHLPPGHHQEPSKNKAAKLLKPIYGLKQSGRNWNSTLDHDLRESGFKRLLSSSCVYVLDYKVILVVYVDDIVIFGQTHEEVNMIVDKLKTLYDLKDLGQVSYLLGVKIGQDGNGFRLNQATYIRSLLSRFQMSDCRPASTPLENGIVLSKRDCPISSDDKDNMKGVPYRELIGCLMHVAISTRPDILFSVTKLSQFNSNPGRIHWNMAKRILRYLCFTRDYELNLSPTSNEILLYSDADWGSDVDDRKSFSGLLVTLGGCAVIWRSKKQNNISTSTMEAEYYALSQATKEAMWLSTFLQELKLSEEFPTPYTLVCDNKSAIDFSKNRVENSRTKHIDIAYHVTREKLEDRLFSLKYVPTKENLADILTKGLGKLMHHKHVASMSILRQQ